MYEWGLCGGIRMGGGASETAVGNGRNKKTTEVAKGFLVKNERRGSK